MKLNVAKSVRVRFYTQIRKYLINKWILEKLNVAKSARVRAYTRIRKISD